MFDFKRFRIDDSRCGMKVGTDGVTLGAWAGVGSPATILDVGTGSGLIALMAAQRFHDAHITALDIDDAALADAAANVADSPWSERIEVVNADFLTYDPHGKLFDLIVCNPPFFTEALQSPQPKRAEARHEGRLGLASLIANAARMLSPGGRLAFIAPCMRDADVEMAAVLNRLHIVRRSRLRQRDSRPWVRTLWELSNVHPGEALQASNLTIRDANGCYTPQYQLLTGDFYL